MYIPTVFKMLDGKVIPELAPGCDWVLTSARTRITVMLDGQCVRIEVPATEPKKMFRRVKRFDKGQWNTLWVLCTRERPEDKALWEAFDEDKPMSEGIYEAIGPDFKSNPHNLPKNRMIKVIPAAYNICPTYNDHGIRFLTTTKIEEFFDSVKKALEHSACDVEGIVFHEEQWQAGVAKVLKAAKVRKEDFGIPWPVIKAETPSQIAAAHTHIFEESDAFTDVCTKCGLIEAKKKAQVPVGVHGPGWDGYGI